MQPSPHALPLTPLALLLLSHAAFGQSAPQHEKISALFDAWRAPGAPGGAVVVVREGKVIHRECIGLADTATKRTINPSTPIYVGSVAKQFTAACIFDLVERGKLKLADDVRSHIPDLHTDLQDLAKEPTVYDLIDHRSGIRDFYEAGILAGWNLAKLPPQSAALRLIYQQRELNFTPGSDFCYSNSGYALLAEIVRRVSGKNFRDYAKERIFDPLGMKHATFKTDADQVVDQAAVGHRPGREGFRRMPVNSSLYGAGGLYASIDDMARWLQHLQKAESGKGYLAAMMKPRPLTRSQRSNPLIGSYGGGLMVGKHISEPVFHGGEFPGHRAHIQHYPGSRVSVAILANRQDGPAPAKLARSIPRLLQVESTSEYVGKAGASKVPAGAYFFRGDSDDEVVMLGVGASGATFKSMPYDLDLSVNDSDTFSMNTDATSVQLTVEMERGKVTGLDLVMAGENNRRFDRIDTQRPGAGDLRAITGTYRSRELDSDLNLGLNNGRLKIANRLSIPLRPFNSVTRDLHFTEPRLMIRVVRDEAEKIIGIRVSTRRARNILFTRQGG